MRRNVTYAAGVARASLAAGPTFLLATALFTAPARLQAIAAGLSVWSVTLLAITVVMLGGFIAVLPNLLGAALMAKWGSVNVGLRLPAVWALIGALVAGGVATGLQADRVVVAAFAATGAFCALLCRSGTHWPD